MRGRHLVEPSRREFLRYGAAGLAGVGLGLSRTGAAVVEPDPCIPGLSYISGDVAGTVPTGETWHVTGDVNLTGDLIVEGTLTGVDTFTLEGNGFQILVQNGGRVDLAGVPKNAWVRWGDPVTGWEVGDRLVVAPNVSTEGESRFSPKWETQETTWAGSWETTFRPEYTDDAVLPDGRVMRPEVVCVPRTITLRSLSRVHFHDGAGVQSLRWVNLTSCGVRRTLDHYPIHFHLNGEASRGSLIEGVVVDEGQNHAFVPHGSHGITFRDVAAVHCVDSPFWWNAGQPEDASNDLLFEHAMVMRTFGSASNTARNLAGFKLRRGTGNVARDIAVAGMEGGSLAAAIEWNETDVWVFDGFAVHNTRPFGIRVWTNGGGEGHLIQNGVIYHCPTGISHGAYLNRYKFRDIALHESPFIIHANSSRDDHVGTGPLTVENVSGPKLGIAGHNKPFLDNPVVYRNVDFDVILYNEGTGEPSWNQFHDSGIVPADITIDTIHPDTIIEIFESGALVHRYESGVWS